MFIIIYTLQVQRVCVRVCPCEKRNTTGNRLVGSVSAVFGGEPTQQDTHIHTDIHTDTHSDTTDWLPSFSTQQKGLSVSAQQRNI